MPPGGLVQMLGYLVDLFAVGYLRMPSLTPLPLSTPCAPIYNTCIPKGEAELTVSSFLEMIRQQKGQHEARLGDTEREQLEFSQAAGDKVFSALSKEERKALESLPADADAYESLHPAIIKRLRREVPEGGVSAAMVRFQLEHYQYFKAAMAAAQEWRDAGNKEAPTADYIGRRVGAPPVPPAPKDPSKLLCTCGSGRLARNCCRPLYVI